MTVFLSQDEGSTWSALTVIDPGPSAYSSLAVLRNMRSKEEGGRGGGRRGGEDWKERGAVVRESEAASEVGVCARCN